MTIYITELITGLLVIAGLFIWGRDMPKKYDMYDLRQILEEMRAYNPKADEYGGKHIIPGWADRIEVALNRMNAGTCQRCNGTGMEDSGGVQPWGEPILIECQCCGGNQS